MADPSLEREALALFEALFDVAEEARPAWIEEKARGRPDLRERLCAMLGAERRLSLATGGAVDALEEEPAPERIGAYRIERRIGRGGMGSIYRGERDAGDFEHAVAIKIIKPGLLSQALVERFERERQTLATLSHPNIAQLYDGGRTADNSPYIVMELIDGEPLLDWADTHAPDRAARIAVFRQICAGVAFAHHNLIVHRDLTPSNVLVARTGTAKLIDFGIARPADVAGEARPVPPAGSLDSLSLTPGYAAPERHLSNEATTSADIYSLGKLLARLFSGHRDAELDAIVAKATAQLPADRYPTVEALAADVDAWEANRPVAAMRGGRGYVLLKFVARNRLPVLAGAGAALALLLAFGATLVANQRAERARAEAEARFAELRSLAGFMIFDLEGELARTVGNIEARRRLVDRAQAYLSALARSPGAPPDVKVEAARGLVTLARVQGMPGVPSFGDYEFGRRNLKAALALLEDPAVAVEQAGQEKAMALAGLAMIEAHHDTDGAKARATVAAAEKALESAPAQARGARWYRAQGALRETQLELALVEQDVEDVGRRAAQLEREVAARPAAIRNGDASRFDLALVDYFRGLKAFYAEKLPESVAHQKAAMARLEALDARRPNDPRILYLLAWAGYVGAGAANGIPTATAEADRFLKLARRTIDRLLPLEPQDQSLRSFAGTILGMEAQGHAAAGRLPEALALQQTVVGHYQGALGEARKPATLHRLALAHVTLANIAVQARERAIVCDNDQSAQHVIAELKQRGKLLGFIGAYEEGVAANLALCRAGAPVSRMRILD